MVEHLVELSAYLLKAVDEAQAYLVGMYVGSHRGALDPRTSNCPFRIT
jgi:hypothetical protein